MRKEIFFAIFAGGLLGLIIAFGIWRANIAFKPKVASTSEKGPTPSPSGSLFSISLAKPENESVITENPVLVSGITRPNAWVSISGEGKDFITQAAENGSFEQEIELVGGVNQVLVTAFDEKGEATGQKLVLVFSTEFGK